MALKFFEPKKSSGSGNTPFVNDWLKDNPKNKETTFIVKEIVRTQSDNGYRVVCDDFQGFIWKNQKLTTLLLEALEVWIKERESGYALFLVLHDPKKPEFTLACDKDVPVSWFTSKNGYTTTESSAVSDTQIQEGTNPFL
jgi:hypothetical protein